MPLTDDAKQALLGQLIERIPATGNRSFGVRRSPTHVHQGVDIIAPKGYPVPSVTDGVVTHASSVLADGFSGYGRHVVVRTGDRWLLYAHLDRVDVSPGDTVEFGDEVGTVGDSCFTRADPSKVCKGVHLHFELSPRAYPQDSEAPRLDPLSWAIAERERYAGEAAPSPKPKRKGKRATPRPRPRAPHPGAIAMVFAGLAAAALVWVGR